MTLVIATPRLHPHPLAVYGIVGLALAGAVHAGSYLGYVLPPDHPLFWGLHIGIFPLFFAFVLRMRRWQSQAQGLLGIPSSKLQWRALLPYFPRWVPPVVVALFIYVGINFFAATSHLSSGARVTSGVPVPAEEAIYTIRSFSGHWLIFYLLPALFFCFVPSSAQAGEDADDGSAA